MAIRPSIPPIVREKLGSIEALCREHHVVRLDLFGSALSDRFDPDQSDLDFVVEFDDKNRVLGLRGDFIALLIKLEKELGRPVDIVEYRAVRNPYFREEIDEKRTQIYAA